MRIVILQISQLLWSYAMGVPKKKTIEKKFNSLPEEIKSSFEHFPKLFEDFPLDVAIVYLFSQIELAQNNTIYCGLARIHRVNAEMAKLAVEKWHMTRPGFREKYEIVFGKKFPEDVAKRLEHAESTRDKIAHGTPPKEGAMRQAIFDIFEFAETYSSEVSERGGFAPFGSLRGFKGRAKSLEKAPSRWILKGMEFNV